MSAPHDRRQDLGVASGQPKPACRDQPLDCSLPALVRDAGHQPLPIGPLCLANDLHDVRLSLELLEEGGLGRVNASLAI
eukprot:2962192-Alexandrium_andersonii.AAC.1